MATQTSQTRYAWTAVGFPLLVLLLLGGGTAAAADSRPDLRVVYPQVSPGNPYAAWPVMPFAFAVRNAGDPGEWDPESHRWLRPPSGGPAVNVVVHAILPPEVAFVTFTQTGGFSCWHLNGVVTCFRSRMSNNTSAQVTMHLQFLNAPPLSWIETCLPYETQLYPVEVEVDPAQTIVERQEGNNTLTLWTGIVCLN
jgi:hypothetical protein